MLLAALPFVRFVQLSAGTARPLFRDTQIRAFFRHGTCGRGPDARRGTSRSRDADTELSVRKALFNAVSLAHGHRLRQRRLHEMGQLCR